MASVEKRKKADASAKAAATTAFNTDRRGTADGRPVFKLGGAKPKAKPTGGARPEKVGSYPAAKPKAAGARPETPGAYPAAKATPAPKPTAKPASAAPKPTARPMKKSSASAPAYTPEKAQKRGNVTSGFSGNWTGAAPTEMQKRGGAKISRGGGLLGAVKRKLGK